MPAKKCVLAYSGGMDSTISIPWIKEHYGFDVVALTVDLGAGDELEGARERALRAGAVQAVTKDVRKEFVENYVFKGLKAGAVYEDAYPLSTALARPLMAFHLVQTAIETGASAIAHGCTGKGNDQVRFDVAIKTLSPLSSPFQIVAPAREWGMTRDEEKVYAEKAGIQLREVGEGRVYSIDKNLWGQAIEGEDLEDMWLSPREDAFSWTQSPENAPDKPKEVVIGFSRGIPVSLDSTKIGGVRLVESLNSTAGRHGIGRIDHIENRLVGIKSREVYEAPAAATLFSALAALETATLARDQQRLKRYLSVLYADLVYDGRWFTALKDNLDAAIDSLHLYTSGEVRMRLYKGSAQAVGVHSEYSLYDYGLSTYSSEDSFDHSAAEGFIDIYALPALMQYRLQTMREVR